MDGKNTSEYFHIDTNEGIVYLKKSLDHETLNAHHFTVMATDKGVPSLSSTAHVWVTGMFILFCVYNLNCPFTFQNVIIQLKNQFCCLLVQISESN
jgi:hypothetical protein